MISSKRNPLVRKLRSLSKRTGREEHLSLLLEGSHLLEEALKKAVEKTDSTKVVDGEGAEPSQELSARVKKLMARKTNLRRLRRQKLPKVLR